MLPAPVFDVIWDYVLFNLRPNGPSPSWTVAVDRLNELLSRPDDPEDPEFDTFDLADILLGYPERETLRLLWDRSVVVESDLVACTGAYSLYQMDLAVRVDPKIMGLFADTPEERSPYWKLTPTGMRLANLLYTLT